MEKEIEKALDYLKNKDDDVALKKGVSLLESISEDVRAQYYLGEIYMNGYGVERNSEKGMDYFLQAATAGYHIAQYRLGLLLEMEDKKSSMQWLIAAAHNGNKEAQEKITFVSNASDESPKSSFHSLDESAQRIFVENVITTHIEPLLSKDGGGIELVHYEYEQLPKIWLKYTGHCSGCSLSSTSTASMILDIFEREIDKNLVLYLW